MMKNDFVFTQLSFGMASKKEDNWIRRFTVTDPFRHHKGFTLYKITSFVSSLAIEISLCLIYQGRFLD